MEKKNFGEKKKFNFLKLKTPPGHPRVSTKYFSPFGPAVLLAIGDIYECLVFYMDNRLPLYINIIIRLYLFKYVKTAIRGVMNFFPLLYYFKSYKERVMESVLKPRLYSKVRYSSCTLMY